MPSDAPLVVVIDYGSGNLRSAAKAFAVSAAELPVPPRILVSDAPRDLAQASHVVLPGVGAFADCMQGLSSIPGMIGAMEKAVLERRAKFLGICVGMQLLATTGLEHGRHKGLGWIPGEVRPLEAKGRKVPHMGWNTLSLRRPHPLFAGIGEGDHAYFVHSYHMVPENGAAIAATTDYGGPVTASLGENHIFGTQFHPEKSQRVGLRLIRNFLSM